MTDRCAIPRCRSQADLSYLGHGICSSHWDRLTAVDQPAGALARALGIPAADAATTEDAMTETPTENTTSEIKTKKGKAPKKTVKAKAATPKTKPAQAAKPKRERAPKEDRSGWGVFAFRLPVPEREAFHKAAGPAGASRTLRTLANAFTAEDPAAFQAIVAEAKKLRT